MTSLHRIVLTTVLAAAMFSAAPRPAAAQNRPSEQLQDQPGQPLHETNPFQDVKVALMRLPLAAALGALLAMRPKRRGTPPRTPAVIQTQIVLAIVGAVIMLVVGASLARAFGIVGVASLVRYRAKVDDPKDAGVMLSTLAVGLATGVGLYALAAAGTVFVLVVLWIVESLEPARQKAFTLSVKTADPAKLRPGIEQLLRRHRAEFELRTTASDEVCYEVRLPFTQRTDRLSNALVALDPSGETAVEWDEKKVK
jgi:uncharacterized membrane protein YhiD involved in acid resistance